MILRVCKVNNSFAMQQGRFAPKAENKLLGKGDTMRFLFIGNSHTYYNDMPQIFKEICEHNQVDAQVTMLAHGGKTLEFHMNEPEVRFNILYGNYDVIILQHRQKDFSAQELLESGKGMDAIISQTNSQKVLYMTWTQKTDQELQQEMARAYFEMGKEIGADVAPVGLVWWDYLAAHPGKELFFEDGRHAAKRGSLLAAYTIYQTIFRKPALPLAGEDEDICKASANICALCADQVWNRKRGDSR